MGMQKTYLKQCEQCLNPFEAGRSYVRFCSSSCASTYGNIKRFGTKEEKKTTSCEMCGLTPDTIYSSGRFCSKKCARSFSTSHARKEITEKAKNTLKDRVYPMHPKRIAWESGEKMNTCLFCNHKFKVEWDKRHLKYCSSLCIRSASSEKMLQRNIEGSFYQSFGRRIRYTDRGLDIPCDSLIEWCAIEHIFQTYGDSVKSIERSSLRIPYEMDGKKRTYVPDFDVLMNDGTRYVVECKSVQSGKTQIWKRYHEESSKKKQVLEEFCASNGIISMWFTQKTRKDLYRRFKEGHNVKSSLDVIQ